MGRVLEDGARITPIIAAIVTIGFACSSNEPSDDAASDGGPSAADAGADAPPARPACATEPDASAVGAYAPMQKRAGLCTAAQIDAFDAACGDTGSDAACATFQDDPANDPCVQCLYGDDEVTHSGVFLGVVVNLAGLLDVNGASAACVAEHWRLSQCKEQSCGRCDELADACVDWAISSTGSCAAAGEAARVACNNPTDSAIVSAQSVVAETGARKDLAATACGAP